MEICAGISLRGVGRDTFPCMFSEFVLHVFLKTLACLLDLAYADR